MLKNNSKRAYHLIVVFSITIVVTILAIISGYLQLELLQNAADGNYVSDAEAEYNDNREAVISVIHSIVFIISIFFFLYWFRRAYGNVSRAGIKTEDSETWAIWSFMIPIISLYKPFKIMKEIWVKTQKAIREFDSTYIANYNTMPIVFWWMLFLFSNFIGNYLIRQIFREETLESYIQLTKAYLISDFIQIIEALMVIFLVYRISKMEEKLIEVYKPKEVLFKIDKPEFNHENTENYR